MECSTPRKASKGHPAPPFGLRCLPNRLTFEIVAFVEPEVDLLTVAAGAAARFGHPEAEAGQALTGPFHVKVSLGARPWMAKGREAQRPKSQPEQRGAILQLWASTCSSPRLGVTLNTPSGMPKTIPRALIASQVYAPWSASLTSWMIRVPWPFSLVKLTL